MEFLSIINFLLVIIVIFAIILLFKRQNQLLDLEKKYRQLNEELEDSMSSFFIQMQEENEAFIKKLKEVQTRQVSSEEKQHLTFENSKTENNGKRSVESQPFYAAIKTYENMQDTAKQSVTDNTNEHVNEEDIVDWNGKEHIESNKNKVLTEHEFEKEQIKELLKAGKTVEEVAKILDKGKTEIELIIKFSPELYKLQNLNNKESLY